MSFPPRSRVPRAWMTARHAVAAFAGCARGSIAVELALITPILTLLALAMFDIGRAYLEMQRMSSAVHAGAQLAVQDPDAEEADVVLRVEQDAGESMVPEGTFSVTASFYCVCPGTSGPANAVDCSTMVQPCTPLAPKQRYVEVRAEDAVDTLFNYEGIGLPNPFVARGFVSMRVR